LDFAKFLDYNIPYNVHGFRNTAEKRLRMRELEKNGEEFKCQIVNKNMAMNKQKVH
jgi:hypothetical protein